MTLAECLRALAKQADDFARVFGIDGQTNTGIQAELHAQVLRVLADDVVGKVLVKPDVRPSDFEDIHIAELPTYVYITSETGVTAEGAIAKLQRKLDDLSFR